MAFQGAGGMPLRGGRVMVWAVGGMAATTVLAAVVYLSVYGLDRADKFGSVIGAEVSVLSLLISLTQLLSDPAAPTPGRGRSGPARRGRLPVQGLGVLLFAVLGVVLIRLQKPFGSRTAGWWAWNGVVVALILLSLGTAVAIAVLADRPRGSRATWVLRGVATSVFVAIAVVASKPWWPTGGPESCGAVQISVDPHLRSQVAGALDRYRESPGESRACGEALNVRDAGPRLHETLLATGTPVAAVITSDPAVLRGLDGKWTNLGAVPEIRTKWHTIGLDRASVLLDRSEHARAGAVTLAELPGLKVGGFAPLDPVALSVITASDQRWRPGFRPGSVDPSGRSCPGHVILPTRWSGSCPDSGPLAPVAVVDGFGNAVGAPVVGVTLTAPGEDSLGPTPGARAAAGRFLSWLDRRPGELDLQNLNLPIRTVLAPLATENALIERYAGNRPVDVTVVLDASASMARATAGSAPAGSSGSAAGGFGATAPWGPAVDGLRRWGRAAPEVTDDRRSFVVARSPRPGSAPGPLDDRWPRTSPHGDTALGRALARARADQRDHARPGRPALVVLVTDGVNLFTERPLSPAALDGVQVVVVGPGRGCAPVARWAGKRCRTADPDGRDVARQVATVVGQFREGTG